MFMLLSWFKFRLNISKRLVKVYLAEKRRTISSILQIHVQAVYKIGMKNIKHTFISHSMIVTAGPGFVSFTHIS